MNEKDTLEQQDVALAMELALQLPRDPERVKTVLAAMDRFCRFLNLQDRVREIVAERLEVGNVIRLAAAFCGTGILGKLAMTTPALFLARAFIS